MSRKARVFRISVFGVFILLGFFVLNGRTGRSGELPDRTDPPRSDYEGSSEGGMEQAWNPQPDSLNVRRVGRALFEPFEVLYYSDGHCYTNSTRDVVMLDVRDPKDPYVSGFEGLPESVKARDIWVEGSRVYVTKGYKGLWILEKVGEDDLEFVGSYEDGTFMYGVVVRDGVAFLTAGGRLLILDVSDPAVVDSIGSFRWDVPGSGPNDVFLLDSLCYVACAYVGLSILDVSDLTMPVEIGRYNTETRNNAVCVQNGLAYDIVADKLMVFNVEDPVNIQLLGLIDLGIHYGVDVQVYGNYAIITEGDLLVINVSDPGNMRIISRVEDVSDFGIEFPYVYALGERGLRIMDLSYPREPEEVGFVDGDHIIYDVYVDGAYGYIADGPDGLYVLDLSNPHTPRTVAVDSTSRVSDVDIEGDYAYLACSTSQLRVLDVGEPSNPLEVSSLWVGNAVSVDAVDTMAYVASGDGLHIVDASDVDSLYEEGFLEIASLKQVVVSGGYAYLACGFSGLRIVDVSEPSTPREVSRVSAWDLTTGVDVSGSYAYMADGYAGVRVIDISNPEEPVPVAQSLAGYGNKIHVVEPYLYLAGGSYGMRVLDISVPDSIHEVGYYGKASQGGIYADGDHIYMGTIGAGLYIFEFTPTGIVTDDEDPPKILPMAGALHQNYPNPFNPQTEISFDVGGEPGTVHEVKLSVYDLRGRFVKTLVDGKMEAGRHVVVWDGRSEAGGRVASGIYFSTLETESGRFTRKMTVVE